MRQALIKKIYILARQWKNIDNRKSPPYKRNTKSIINQDPCKKVQVFKNYENIIREIVEQMGKQRQKVFHKTVSEHSISNTNAYRRTLVFFELEIRSYRFGVAI